MLKVGIKLFVITILIIANDAFGQSPEDIIRQVNESVSEVQSLHVKTVFRRKYYTDNDTSIRKAETWIHKNQIDTFLGMDIRTKSLYSNGFFETIHKGSQTWSIDYSKDTITRYDLLKGHWDGFNGNIKTDWTIHLPTLIGIRYTPSQDSLSLTKDGDDWVIQINRPDSDEYPITNRFSRFWIDSKTMLPYVEMSQWEMEGEVTYNELTIDILDMDSTTVCQYLESPLPDYPIMDYIKPDLSKYKPLSVGDTTPEMEGYFLKDSSAFLIANYKKDRLILIDFWYQACGPCMRAIPYLDSIQNEFESKGLIVMSVNSRDHDKNRKDLIDFFRKRGGHEDWVIMTDFKTETKKWKSYMNPTFYLVKDNKIVWVQQGFGPDLMPTFREEIKANL